MGYYVRITKSDARIPAANLKRAYQKMCALNHTHHKQKRGGSFSGNKLEPNSSWFSWMDPDYPKTCKDAQAVLEMLGFDTEYTDHGDLLIVGYDNKTGQEDLFLKAIENEAVGSMEWIGEDGEGYTTEFTGGTVLEAEQCGVRLLK